MNGYSLKGFFDDLENYENHLPVKYVELKLITKIKVHIEHGQTNMHDHT